MVLLASSYDQTRFFKAADLESEKKLRIKTAAEEAVTEEVIGVGAEQKKELVVWFTNDKRGLVLNKTNNRTLRGAFGDPCAGWAGKIIVLFPSTTDLRGKMVPCLRVRIPPPKQATATPAATPQPQPSESRGAATPLPQSGNGAAVVMKPETVLPVQAVPASDPELEPDPTVPLADDMNDEIPF